VPAGVEVAAACIAAKDTAMVGHFAILIPRVVFIKEFFELKIVYTQ
jgi:hypothetical protein